MTSHVDEPVKPSLKSASEPGGEAPPDLATVGKQFTRTSQLFCEGALSLLLKTSVRDVWDGLVRAGIEWEDEYTRVPEPRAPNQS
jgi:hypothetical protein